MPVNNIKVQKVEVELAGKKRFFLYNFRAAAILADKFGSAIEAQVKLNEACFKQIDGKFVPRGPTEITTKDFFDTMACYVDALLSQDIKEGGEPVDFFDLDANDLTGIVQAIWAALGFGSPESDGKKNPQKP